MTDPSSSESIHILLVEDNPGDVRLTQEAFSAIEQGVEFHVVTDGEEAVKYAHQHLQPDAESRPDLVLLDLNLPRVDGFGVLEMFGEELEAPPPPVLILSSSDATDDIKQSYEKGCNAYLTKPDDMEDYARLAEAIKEFWVEQVQPPVVSS